jgi:hypothetical protein
MTKCTDDDDSDTEMETKPVCQWSATETVLYMLDAVREGVFYIIVPDGDTRKAVDQLRIMWAAADVADGRPALSRWHPNYKVRLFEGAIFICFLIIVLIFQSSLCMKSMSGKVSLRWSKQRREVF